MKKRILIILGIICTIAALLFLYLTNKKKLYEKNFFYMDTYINLKVYSNNKEKADETFKNVDDIYNKYQSMTDAYDENSEIYYINNNSSEDEYITISNDLYNMIKLSLDWYEKSNGKFNINMGSVIKVWKSYRDASTGVPSYEELASSGSTDINEIILGDNNTIKNTHPNLDLGAISKGYATEEVGKYLKKNNIENFILNAGGNVLVGKAYNKDYYSVGIENPEDKTNLYKIVKGNNIAVVTSGGYERFYEYEGVRYHHIIDPETLYPANNMKGVTVISKDSAIADILSTTLFLMDKDEAIDFINKLDDTECVIYVNKDEILTSKGFKNYE